MTKAPKKINYTKWGVIVTALIGIPGAIATLITFPELGCKVGLNTPACIIPQKDIEFVVQGETGEPLHNVTAEAIAAKGAPEVQYTDDRGYVKINIPSKGDIRITLSKKDYPTQNFIVNLANEQDTIRIIKFSQSGQPSVQPVASLPPSPSVSVSSTPSATPTSVTNAPIENPVKTDGDVTWELKQCLRKQADVSCSFVLTTTSDRKVYDFWLTDYTKLTDHQGHEYLPSQGTFVDKKAGAGSNINHEMQKGSTYAVNIDFAKVPTSISEVNSLIVGNRVKFDDVPIK